MTTKPSITRSVVVLHRHDPDDGLQETSVAFSSLEELFATCTSVEPSQLIDHMIISGVDAHGQPRSVAFGFHAMTTQGED